MMVCKLQKDTYWLRQAPLSLYAKLLPLLSKLGVHPTEVDHGIFDGRRALLGTNLAVYVNDLILLYKYRNVIYDVF